jgi:hypothetical protein
MPEHANLLPTIGHAFTRACDAGREPLMHNCSGAVLSADVGSALIERRYNPGRLLKNVPSMSS